MVQLAPAPQRTTDEPTRPQPAPAGGPRTSPTFLALASAIAASGVAAIVAARWATGTGYVPAVAGLADSGQVTAIGTPLAQFAHTAAGIAVVGLLLMRALGAGRSDHQARARLGVLSSRWAFAWVVSTVVWMVFTASELIGVPVWALPGHLDSVVLVIGTTRMSAEILTAWIAVGFALFGDRPVRPLGLWLGVLVAVTAMVPSSLTGHASHHASPVIATTALAVHVAASALWVGGLLAVALHLRVFPRELSAVLPRFSACALVCVAGIALTGVVETAVTFDTWSQLFSTHRGALIIAKTVALLGLTGIGYAHRRYTVGRVRYGELLPLLRLAGVELAIMGATIGLAVTLSTTA